MLTQRLTVGRTEPFSEQIKIAVGLFYVARCSIDEGSEGVAAGGIGTGAGGLRDRCESLCGWLGQGACQSSMELASGVLRVAAHCRFSQS